MRPTGRRSSTSGAAFLLALALVTLSGVRPVRALDLFTLWRQPEIPLRIVEGEWVDYRGDVMAGGRRQQTLTRVACLGRDAGSDDASWLLEILPLRETAGGRLEPLPGEGVRLRLSRDLLRREGRLLDAVVDAEHWTGGRAEKVSAADLRDDPLLSLSLDEEFSAQHVARMDSTTRVISDQLFLCGQFVLSAADTQRISLPAGVTVQETSREITAAVHPDLPFLGLAYISERVRSESRVEGEGGRRRRPPPRIRVEVMELVGFGRDAQPALARDR
jgi:hypothetical protein